MPVTRNQLKTGGRSASFLLGVITTFFALLIVLFLAVYYLSQRADQGVELYMKRMQKVKRKVIENHPIFSDYATGEKVSQLRKHLLQDHLKVSSNSGHPALKDEEALKDAAKNGWLVSLDGDRTLPLFFYNVPRQHRYLTSHTVEGVRAIGKKFNAKLNLAEDGVRVKFALSSLVRPAEYQKGLRQKNGNASERSSHSYGISFDIFYDEFYFDLSNEPDFWPASYLWARIDTPLGYLMGEALARQLQSVLMETLIELQEEGLLFAIIEKKQRVFHVTILPEPGR